MTTSLTPNPTGAVATLPTPAVGDALALTGPVLVGVDGSRHAERALQVAARLARAFGTEVVAVHAVGMMTELDGQFVPTDRYLEVIDRRLRLRWCAALTADTSGADGRTEPLHWRAALQFGDPASVLTRLADELGASVVVVGSRGHGEAAPELLGSTSHHVVHHCRRPVVVVPPAEPARAGAPAKEK